MRRFLIAASLGTALGFSCIVQAQAQAGFIFGFALGSMMADGSPASSRLSGDVLYLLPRAAERVKDPLEIRQVGSAKIEIDTEKKTHSTIAEIFQRSLPDSDEYEILAVQRFDDNNGSGFFYPIVRFLFTYIDKTKVIPLDQLPPPQKQARAQ